MNTVNIGLLVVGSVSAIFSIIAFIFAVLAYINIKAMEKSTHSVQLMPVDPEIDAHNQKITEQWATSEDSLKKQQKLYREDLEENLSEFYEEEKEIISY